MSLSTNDYGDQMAVELSLSSVRFPQLDQTKPLDRPMKVIVYDVESRKTTYIMQLGVIRRADLS